MLAGTGRAASQMLKPACFSTWDTLGFLLIVMHVSPLDRPVVLPSSGSPRTLPRLLCKFSFTCVSPLVGRWLTKRNLLGFYFLIEDDVINLLLESKRTAVLRAYWDSGPRQIREEGLQ